MDSMVSSCVLVAGCCAAAKPAVKTRRTKRFTRNLQGWGESRVYLKFLSLRSKPPKSLASAVILVLLRHAARRPFGPRRERLLKIACPPPINTITRDDGEPGILEPLFHPLAQSAGLCQQAHAIHQVVEGHDADQPFLVDDGNQREAAGGEFAEGRGQRFAAASDLKGFVHGALDVAVPFAAQALNDGLAVDHAYQIAAADHGKIILQAV